MPLGHNVLFVLGKNGPFLLLFGTYTDKYTKNIALLPDLCSNYPAFNERLQEFQKLDICKNLPISSYFLSPVQRLPRYKLLLHEFSKKLKGTADYEEAIKAIGVGKNIFISKLIYKNFFVPNFFFIFSRKSNKSCQRKYDEEARKIQINVGHK